MKLLSIILLFALLSCSDTSHEVRYKPDGTDSVAYIRYFDGVQFNTFYMSYPNFKIIYDSAGYEGCYEYYINHEMPLYWKREYSKYK